MEDLKFGKWSFLASCETDDKNIRMIELHNGEKRWYARYNMDKHVFLDALPQDCAGSDHLADSFVYTLSIAI